MKKGCFLLVSFIEMREREYEVCFAGLTVDSDYFSSFPQSAKPSRIRNSKINYVFTSYHESEKRDLHNNIQRPTPLYNQST